ncbi:MAG: hypothetical protein IH943_11295 [Acidobacteria bacterium]|nr:hypothetical protein [Acidobacteriota bacterium]
MTLDNQQEERVRGAFAALTDFTPVGAEFDELTDVYIAPSVRPLVSSESQRGWLIAVAGAVVVLILGLLTVLTRETDPELSASAFTWSRVPYDEAVFGGSGAQSMSSVTVGGPGLVAVGSSWDGEEDRNVGVAVVWTSPDGVVWSRVPHDEAVFGGSVMSSVTAGGPGLVAVGEAGSDAAVWTSPDGVVWSRVPHDEAVFGGSGAQSMSSVTVGGPGLVAVGSSWEEDRTDVAAAVWTSPDGVNWSRVPHNKEIFGGAGFQNMQSVTVGGPGLVAVGSEDGGLEPGAAVWTSVDGITWSRVPHNKEIFGGEDSRQMQTDGAGRKAMNGVTAGGPGLVAVGSDGFDAAVWTSPDGVTWSRVPHDESVFGGATTQSMWSVTVASPGLVAVGGDSSGDDVAAAVWTSPDGVNWSRVPHNKEVFGGAGFQNMQGVTVGGPGLVAVGDAESDAAVWLAATED